jgi:TRAP-type C4-dicarboxylate transport system permease small subunit
MSTEAEDAPKFSIFQRVLAYIAVALIALAVAAYLTTLIVGLLAGREALAGSLWPIVVGISYVGLPVGFVLLVILLAISYRRRGSRRGERV